MKPYPHKVRIGILGCGAIGSGIAASTLNELKDDYALTGLHDRDASKAESLAHTLKKPLLKKDSLSDLLDTCDIMVEAVNSPAARRLIHEALEHKKDVLAMSVGRLLHAPELFTLARNNHCHLLVPSGAIAGIDAVKAGSLKTVTKIVLTTRKPVTGFSGLSYLEKINLDLSRIKGETVLFDGSVAEAVEHFPQNINVAATLALACGDPAKIRVRILTSPKFTTNSHEIEMTGDFGRMTSRTENTVCPDNPKTSFLAVLSAIQTLKDFGRGVRIGT